MDEQLGTYLQCLGPKNRLAWYLEETSMRKRLNISSMTDEMLGKLKETSGKHPKTIRTTPNYEMTSNPKYAQLLQYT